MRATCGAFTAFAMSIGGRGCPVATAAAAASVTIEVVGCCSVDAGTSLLCSSLLREGLLRSPRVLLLLLVTSPLPTEAPSVGSALSRRDDDDDWWCCLLLLLRAPSSSLGDERTGAVSPSRKRWCLSRREEDDDDGRLSPRLPSVDVSPRFLSPSPSREERLRGRGAAAAVAAIPVVASAGELRPPGLIAVAVSVVADRDKRARPLDLREPSTSWPPSVEPVAAAAARRSLLERVPLPRRDGRRLPGAPSVFGNPLLEARRDTCAGGERSGMAWPLLLRAD